ncbi:uncharacterized protein [Malus domestica]|uniref:uncharacterized protein n=1 Tax=Malus domestica TaxID=3750 RepID=UPI0039763BA5
MVIVSQLQILQSSITSLISSVSTSVAMKLDDTNYLTWHFQMQLLLEGFGIMGFVDGSTPCPPRFSDVISGDSEVVSGCSTAQVEYDAYKIWKMHDRALMQLISATLLAPAISCAIGSISSLDLWTHLKDQFSTVSRTSIFQMKYELQTIKKGNDSVTLYLQRIKEARDYLSAAGVYFEDDDIVILTLTGLPSEFNTIRSVIRGRDTVISLKDLRSQLLAEEAMLENMNAAPVLTDLVAQQSGFPSKNSGGFSSQHPNSNYQYNSSRGFNNKNKGRDRFNSNNRNSNNSADFCFQKNSNVSMTAMYAHTNSGPQSTTSQSSIPSQQVWLTYSGATNHMTTELQNLSLAILYPSNETIQAANGEGQNHMEDTYKRLCSNGVYPIISPTSSASSKRAYAATYLGQQINSRLWHNRLVPNNDNVMVVPSVSSPSLMQSSSSQFAPNNSLDIRSHLITTNSLSNGSSLSMPSATSSSHTLTGDLNEVVPITSTADQSLSSSISVVPEFQPDQLQVVIYVPSFNLHPMQTRSKSGISKKIAFMSMIHEHGGADLTKVEPATYKFSLTSFVWCEAMKEELSALHNQGTWFLVPLPPHKNLVGCKWVFKIKKNVDGSIGRYKARLVAKGFNKKEGIDYGETFSPVVKPTTVRLVIVLAAHYG